MRNTYTTPILFLIFNRPDTTKRVFEAIRQYRPAKLFVAADGPRKNKPGEVEKCAEAREIIDEGVDWHCKVYKLYQTSNLGCGVGPYEAISWFFKNVEKGIILEDDCLPDISFFKYCEVLLEKYKNNLEIMHIGGDNFQGGVHRGEKYASYYFSEYPHTWGWATWRRAWKKYSFKIDKRTRKYKDIFKKMNFLEKIYWGSLFLSVNKNLLDAWDYQWLYTIWKNNSICITPNRNLVINIGVGENATHTNTENDVIGNMKLNEIKKIIHPKIISVDLEADKYTLNYVFGVSIEKRLSILLIIPSLCKTKIINNFGQIFKDKTI